MAKKRIAKKREKITKKKTIIPDTNVILHDDECLYHFDEHDIILSVVVLEELDGFKRGKEQINVNARKFLRNLDALSKNKIFNEGVKIGNGNGLISIKLKTSWCKEIIDNFSPDKPDHHILNTAYAVAKKKGFKNVILATKDINLRLKAKSVGLLAENYTSDCVKNVSDIYKGIRSVEGLSEKVINSFYQPPFEADLPNNFFKPELLANEYLTLKNGNKSILAVFDSHTKKLRSIQIKKYFGIKAYNTEQAFAFDALMNENVPLVTLTGKAGTGKTLVALAAALELKKNYRQILIARPAVPLSNKDSGFLPGKIENKLDPYMQPLFDNLSVIQNGSKEISKQIQGMRKNKKIEIAPLFYIRGRSIVKAYFIIDEAQNVTPHEIKQLLHAQEKAQKLFLPATSSRLIIRI